MPVEQRRIRVFVNLIFVLGLLGVSANVWAIPSPDLVINLTASLAQLLGMVSVLMGSFFVSRNKRTKSGAANAGSVSKVPFIAVVTVLVISAGINIWQFARQSDIRSQQLNANLYRKATENGKEVGGVSLKTLSVSEQVGNNRGMTTDELSAIYRLGQGNSILAPNSPVTLIDVREDEEVEAGRIPGAIHIRYPDLLKDPSLLKSSENVVLLCYSGNRSSELTGALGEQGLETRFMIGGYEKWMAEGRVLDVVSGDRQNLREIPDYENRDKLLETKEVQDLVQNQEAVFVDVRYPSEFEGNHLPGALNLTVRAEPSHSLQQKISALPDRPVIGVCYDRRSCFYSQILGLKISRQGYTFAGRFTVPHEYTVPVTGKTKQYVADWQAQNQASLFGLLQMKLGEKVSLLVESTGSIILTLFILALAVRVLLLPLFLKMERDRLVLKRLAPTMLRIKKRHSHDMAARAAVTSDLHRENRITPVVTLVGSLLNLGLLFLIFGIVNKQSLNWSEPLLWAESAGLPDNTWILPGINTLLVLALAVLMCRPLTKVKAGLVLAGTLTIGLLVVPLSAAVNVYLLMSLLVVFVQMAMIAALDRYYGWSTGNGINDVTADSEIIPLKNAHQFPLKTGKKAARLGELISAGYNVPDGFVVSGTLAGRLSGNDNDGTADTALVKAWKKISARKVAVRSSGVAEDGDNASFAGVYDSLLNIERDVLCDSVVSVYQSLDDGLSSEYAKKQVLGSNDSGGGVLVQKMVDADYAGVLFTEHPLTAGKMLVEMIAGLGDDLVSGSVTPTTHEFGRRSLKADGDAPIDLTELLKTAVSIEQKFGKPQDIEWAYKSGVFYILQARDITRSITRQALSVRGLVERERDKILRELPTPADDKNETLLAQNELSELLPRPTPISVSFMQKLWDFNGSTQIACERLRIPYRVNSQSPTYVNQFFGWLYVNKMEERKRLKSGPGALVSFKLARDAEVIADHFEQNFLPPFKQRMDTLAAVDFERLSVDKLVKSFAFYTEQFVTQSYVEAEIINICNQFYWNAASSKLAASNIDPNTVLGALPQNVVSQSMNLLAQSNNNPAAVGEFLELFGHRAPTDYELAQPRYCEDPELVQKQIDILDGKQTVHAEPVVLKEKLLQIAVQRVRRFQALKEEAKHQCLREFYLLRKVLLALDVKLGLDGGIFYLDCDEVQLLADTKYVAVARQLIRIRRNEEAEYKEFQPPAKLTLADIEEFDPMANDKPGSIDRPDSVSGTRVAGDVAVSGVVHVIRDESEVARFREGEILVAKMTNPSWYPLFPLAKGIITEVGGWLSHAAIVAREYDLPATVGVENATQHLRSGDIVKMHTDGTIERLANQRAPDSPMRVSVPAAVAARDEAGKIITDPNVVALPLRENSSPQNSDLQADDQSTEQRKSGTDE